MPDGRQWNARNPLRPWPLPLTLTSASTIPSSLSSLYGYKAWANAELFASLAQINSSMHATELHQIMRILNHIYVVDSIFKGHLLGVPHGHTDTNTKDTPTLGNLALWVKETDTWYCAYVGGLSPADLLGPVRFTFTDGDAGLMSREEILLHVIAHGAYHRGAAGQVMRATNVPPPRDLYTRFLRLDQQHDVDAQAQTLGAHDSNP